MILLLSILAGTICNDNWMSPSNGQGTCSHHGGVKTFCDQIVVDGIAVNTCTPCVQVQSPSIPIVNLNIGSNKNSDRVASAAGVIGAASAVAVGVLAAKTIADENEYWNESVSLAQSEAEHDCRNFSFCDSNIDARAKRINACKYHENDKSSEKYDCSISYREAILKKEKLIKLIDDVAVYVDDNLKNEIIKNYYNNNYTVCILDKNRSIVSQPRNSAVFFVYSKSSKATIDKMSPEKYNVVSKWVEEAKCSSLN